MKFINHYTKLLFFRWTFSVVSNRPQCRVSTGTVLFDTNTSVCYMLSDGGVLLCPELVEQEAKEIYSPEPN